MKIFIGNLPYYLGGSDIRQLFELFGPVNSAKIIMENNSGKSKGFGFLEMQNDQQGEQAIRELDGKEIDGRNIVVRLAESQPPPEKIHKRPRIASTINKILVKVLNKKPQ